MKMRGERLPDDIDIDNIESEISYNEFATSPEVYRVKSEMERYGIPFEDFEYGIYRTLNNARELGLREFSIRVRGLPKLITIEASLGLPRLLDD
jgi:hypothetical protein